MDVETQSIVYKEEKIIKKKNKHLKNIIFSPNVLFIISVNEFKSSTENNIFLFGYVDKKWKFLESFLEEAKSIDAYFTSDSTFHSKTLLTISLVFRK